MWTVGLKNQAVKILVMTPQKKVGWTQVSVDVSASPSSSFSFIHRETKRPTSADILGFNTFFGLYIYI